MTATHSPSGAPPVPAARPAPAPSGKKPQGGPLSIAQMLRLMQAEYDRAQRHNYPIAAMMITADRLEGMEADEAGAFRKRIMPAIFGLLKVVTRDLGTQGLGCWTGNRAIAVFPHVAPWNIKPLTEQLLDRARKLAHSSIGEAGENTLSIGLAHNQHADATNFEYMLEEAETGLTMALSAGGDRFVQWKEVEGELEDLRGDLQDEAAKIVARAREMETRLEEVKADGGTKLVSSIQEIFDRVQDKTPTIERLEKELVALAHFEVQREREEALEGQMAEHRRQVDMLERRVAKLTELLETTESELKRVAKMKAVDNGIASIYRSVQGLSDDDDDAEVKKEMMTAIFQANLEFQKK